MRPCPTGDPFQPGSNMKRANTKSNFGQLLERYCEAREVESQTQLKRLLESNGFSISISAVNKYQTGTRSPPVDFIYHVSVCLNLDDEQTSALLNACGMDFYLGLIKEYTEYSKTMKQRLTKD
jgi:hypothetical protein